ncbi:MAG: acetamidase/formamidase family protein, partial [Armatimonadota bacterium]
GAEPGDVLVAEVLDIKPGAVGLVSAHPRGGGRREWKRVALDGGVAVFRDDLRLPLEPVIGTIGVAPEAGSVPNSTPGDHGGNLDTPDVKVGTKVHLPVAVAGALFGLGDVHALQADGEVCGQGIEVEAEVAVRIDVRRGLTLKRPMIETDVHFAFCASAKTLEEAVPIALGDARDFLIRRLGVTDAEALMLMSLVGDVRISQIVNPLKTVRACVPRSLVAE